MRMGQGLARSRHLVAPDGLSGRLRARDAISLAEMQSPMHIQDKCGQIARTRQTLALTSGMPALLEENRRWRAADSDFSIAFNLPSHAHVSSCPSRSRHDGSLDL